MWVLRPCNWHHFCDTADEHHAICLGAFTPFFMWKFMVNHAPDAKRLLDIEPWYVAFGMTIRGISCVLIGWKLLEVLF